MTLPLDILSRSFRPVDLPRRVQVGCSRCGTALVGVYLLVARDEITYIGSSTDIVHRLYDHLLDRRRCLKRFDRALWLPLPASVLPHYEGALIRALQPRHNGKIPRSHGYDAEILWGLGLKAELSDEEIAADAIPPEPSTRRRCERRPNTAIHRALHRQPLRPRSPG